MRPPQTPDEAAERIAKVTQYIMAAVLIILTVIAIGVLTAGINLEHLTLMASVGALVVVSFGIMLSGLTAAFKFRMMNYKGGGDRQFRAE